MNSTYQICTQCIMDTTDPDIQFDENGICNHCKKAGALIKVIKSKEHKEKLNQVIEEIKLKGGKKKYDCIIGVSGGVDSTFVAYIVKQLGLRPLAVHLDNGWDSELAVSNIEKTLKKLGIDLFTYVIDWEEFKDLQLSFLKASVPHAEHPTDHAITAILHRMALKEGVKYIILGSNINTEAIGVKAWSGGQRDWKYIKKIHEKFGKAKLKSYPHISGADFFYYKYIKGIKCINILDYVDYHKEQAMNIIERELGWKYYGGKHYESIFTRFFQAYLLPQKFNFDKRKIHLSSLICSGQITRQQALEEMKKEIYQKEQLREDKEFVIKKFGISEQEFKDIMALPVKTFWDYPSYENSWWYHKLYPFIKRKEINQ